MAPIVLLLIVQIWLLSATLESFLAGHVSVVLPAAGGELFVTLGFCFCVSVPTGYQFDAVV